MGGCKNKCKEMNKVCLCVKDPCGKKRKVKATIEGEKSIGVNKNVLSPQPLTSNTTTVLHLTGGSFSFNSCGNCKSCCNPCGYNNNVNNNNGNVICLPCKGLYNITAFIVLDLSPGSDQITMAVDINSQQLIAIPLVGNGTTINFSTNLNLCANSRIQFRIYQIPITQAVNVIGGQVSVAKVGSFVCC